MMASTADIDAGLAFLAPSRLRHAIDSSSSFAVIWDSGATVCITNDPKDFVDGMQPPGAITKVKGLAKGLSIKGRGYVTWVVVDTAGKLRRLKVKAYYVYNCVFDDWFSTVQSSVDSIPDFESPEWQKLFGDSMFQYTFDDDHADDDGDIHDGTAPDVDPSRRRERVEQAMSREQPVVPLPVDAPAVSPRIDSSSHMRESSTREESSSSVDNSQSVSTSTLTNSNSVPSVSSNSGGRLSAPMVSQSDVIQRPNPDGANLPTPPDGCDRDGCGCADPYY